MLLALQGLLVVGVLVLMLIVLWPPHPPRRRK